MLNNIKAFSGSYQHRIAKSNTKIVIEGPPRCGNSSALRLVIRNNQSFKNKIATKKINTHAAPTLAELSEL
mgnify:CR=1 FL=1